MPKTVEQCVIENLGGLQFILCQKEVQLSQMTEDIEAKDKEIANLKAQLGMKGPVAVAPTPINGPESGQTKEKKDGK